jgi:hypothetical protein
MTSKKVTVELTQDELTKVIPLVPRLASKYPVFVVYYMTMGLSREKSILGIQANYGGSTILGTGINSAAGYSRQEVQQIITSLQTLLDADAQR